MAILFLDCSALVKRYVPEIGSAWLQAATEPASGNSLYAARITGVEVVSAVTRRQRRGDITPSETSLVLASFRRDFPTASSVIEVIPTIVTQAMDIAEKHGLRGYDAVQLAAASALHEQIRVLGLPALLIATADKDLNAAALKEGLRVEDPNNHF